MKSVFVGFCRWKPYETLKSAEWWAFGILFSIMHRPRKPPNMHAWNVISQWTLKVFRSAQVASAHTTTSSLPFASLIVYYFQITMDFSYLYNDDPDHDELRGNITWIIPDFEAPAHWIHAEMTCTKDEEEIQLAAFRSIVVLIVLFCWLICRRGYLQHIHFGYGLQVLGTDNALRRKGQIDEIFVGIAAITRTQTRHKCHQLFAVSGDNVWEFQFALKLTFSILTGRNCHSMTSICHSCSQSLKINAQINDKINGSSYCRREH